MIAMELSSSTHVVGEKYGVMAALRTNDESLMPTANDFKLLTFHDRINKKGILLGG